MLKLRFVVLFLLFGLYFAESSPVHSDSGETSPNGSGASGSEKKEGSTGAFSATKKLTHLISDQAVSETNGEKKEPEGGSSKEKGAERENRQLGHDLPGYIGTVEEKETIHGKNSSVRVVDRAKNTK
uniref:Putative secreted protein n=1 Tax=Ixodes ricinus TaxID=34613 RepID=V5H8A3_IXORI